MSVSPVVDPFTARMPEPIRYVMYGRKHTKPNGNGVSVCSIFFRLPIVIGRPRNA